MLAAIGKKNFELLCQFITRIHSAVSSVPASTLESKYFKQFHYKPCYGEIYKSAIKVHSRLISAEEHFFST